MSQGRVQGGRGGSGEAGQGANPRAPPLTSFSQVVPSGSSVKFLPALRFFCDAQDPRHQKPVATLASNFNRTRPGPPLGLSGFLPLLLLQGTSVPTDFHHFSRKLRKLIFLHPTPHSSQAPTLLQLLKRNSCSQISRTHPPTSLCPQRARELRAHLVSARCTSVLHTLQEHPESVTWTRAAVQGVCDQGHPCWFGGVPLTGGPTRDTRSPCPPLLHRGEADREVVCSLCSGSRLPTSQEAISQD